MNFKMGWKKMNDFKETREACELEQFLKEYCAVLKEELNLRLLCEMDITGNICWLEDIQLSNLTYPDSPEGESGKE